MQWHLISDCCVWVAIRPVVRVIISIYTCVTDLNPGGLSYKCMHLTHGRANIEVRDGIVEILSSGPGALDHNQGDMEHSAPRVFP